jgi:hypothetical protein
MDMILAWMKEYCWDRPDLVGFVAASAAVGDRGVEYPNDELGYWKTVPMPDHETMHAMGDLKGTDGMQHGEMSGMTHGDMGRAA